MPKCAGRTIKRLLEQNYNNQREINSNPFLLQMLDDELNSYDLIEGHMVFEYIKRLKGFKYLTMFRDPLERTISQYNHFMTMPTSVREAEILKEHKYTFHEFVTSRNPNIALWVNVYTTQLGDDGGYILDIPRYLERAIQNLKEFDFIGIYERFDETIKAMKKRYNLNGSIGVAGKTPEKNKTMNISEHDRKVARRYLNPDYILYEMAKEKFNETSLVE